MKCFKLLCGSSFFSKQIQKKSVCFFAGFVLFISANIFALGAGVQFGAGSSFFNLQNFDENPNKSDTEFFGDVTGTMRFFRIPLVLGFGIEGAAIQNDFALGFSGFADFWILNLQIKNNWNFYGGAGISGGIIFPFSDEKQIVGSCGLRMFCGVETILLDNFIELYAQLTGNPNIVFGGKNSKNGAAFSLKVPLEAGIRFHF